MERGQQFGVHNFEFNVLTHGPGRDERYEYGKVQQLEVQASPISILAWISLTKRTKTQCFISGSSNPVSAKFSIRDLEL